MLFVSIINDEFLIFSILLQECIMGALKDKTVLLVTHQVDFLHNIDSIMV